MANVSRGDSNPRTRPYNLTLTKVPYEARDEFRRLTRPDTYFEIKPGEVGERVAYRVEMTPEEYERAQRVADDPESNLTVIEPDLIGTPDAPAVPGKTELTYLAAQRAWDNGIRGQGVRVAVLDTGCAFTKNNIVASKSLVIYEDGSSPDPLVDNNGHGTKMASLAAPRQSGLLVGQISAQPDGRASYSNQAAGIHWAIENGADVINLSYSGEGEDTVIRDAVADAYNANAVFFCSMGNHGTSQPYYPAAYPYAHAIANFQSATDSKDNTSATGSHVFLASTGNRVTWYKANGTQETTEYGGTSAACALAAHCAALLISRGYSKANTLHYMRRTARRTGASPNAEGRGVIQMYAVNKKVEEEKPPKRRLSLKGTEIVGGGGGDPIGGGGGDPIGGGGRGIGEGVFGIEYELNVSGRIPRDGCV